MHTIEEYQDELVSLLAQLYPGVDIRKEWSVVSDERGIYSPRIDIAVGPLANTQRHITEYDEMMDDSRQFITELIQFSTANIREFYWNNQMLSIENLKILNSNARCFMAIEIENNTSRKHILGAAVNAVALGRMGIAIGWTPEKMKAFAKLRGYLDFLRSVGKNTFDASGLIILTKEQLRDAIERAIRNRGQSNGG